MRTRNTTTTIGSSSSQGGISISLLLTTIFVVLKLTGVITWSWWVVFLPSLISFGIGFIITLVALLIVRPWR